jgi:hypothetical protein
MRQPRMQHERICPLYTYPMGLIRHEAKAAHSSPGCNSDSIIARIKLLTDLHPLTSWTFRNPPSTYWEALPPSMRYISKELRHSSRAGLTAVSSRHLSTASRPGRDILALQDILMIGALHSPRPPVKRTNRCQPNQIPRIHTISQEYNTQCRITLQVFEDVIPNTASAL